MMVNKRKSFIKLILFTLILISSFFYTKQTEAAVVKVDSDSPVIEAKNNLIFEKNMTKKPKGTVEYTNATGSLKYFEGEGNQYVPTFQPGYGGADITLTNTTAATTVKVTYDYVGKYNGKEIGGTLTLSNFGDKNSAEKVRFVFSNNFYSGFWYHGAYQMDPQIKLFYTSDKSAVKLEGDSYLTVNSLNGKALSTGAPVAANANEFAAYLNQPAGYDTYLTKDSNILEIDNPFTSGKIFAGASENFGDSLGSSTFKRNSISFKVGGTELNLRLGTIQKMNEVWTSFNSATLFNVKPDAPNKKVFNAEGINYNKEKAYPGQRLTYQIEQKVNTLGIDVLQRYTKFSIKDKLDDKLTYVSSKLVDKNNNAVDTTGAYTFDKDTNTLTYTASKDFLNKMPLNGEVYRLLIVVDVKKDVKEGELIKNTGTVTIDNSSDKTNEVENPTAIEKLPPSIKDVLDNDGTTIPNNMLYQGQKFKYFVEKKLGTYGKDTYKTKYSKLEITDKLPKEIGYESAYFELDGKKIDNPGTINYDQSTHTVTFKASKEFLDTVKPNGQTIRLYINSNVLETTVGTIKNTATVTIDDMTDDPDVTVDIPKDAAVSNIRKKIIDKDGKLVDSNTVLIGETFSYKLTVVISPIDKLVTKVEITDAVPLGLPVESVVLKEGSTDITAKGKLEITNNKFVWTASNPKDHLGKKIDIEVSVKVTKDKTILQDHILNEEITFINKAQLVVKEDVIDSNEVVSKVPVLEPAAVKKIVK